jgi:glycosyltransferase involved in cell wall biosynthesis
MLSSLRWQLLSSDKFEVLVIDNGSIDETSSVVRAYSTFACNIKYLVEHKPGLHAGRHTGLREAKGEILVFADDDIEALPTWLLAIEESFALPDTAMVGGNNLPIFIGSPPIWLYDLWSKENPDGSLSLSSLSIQEHPQGNRDFNPYMVWGCNYAIRKDVLIAAGGFHPDGMPQDLIRFRGDGETHVSKYVADNNLKCIFDSRATVYHKVTPERMTFVYFRKRGFNQGVSDSYTHLRNPPEAHLDNPPSSHRKLMLILKNNLRTAKLRALGWATKTPSELNPAQAAFQEGYKEGFAYHQAAYATDPEVRAWVHKETYFE